MRKSKRNPATKKTWKQKDDEVGDPEVEGNVEVGAMKRKATSVIEKSLPRFKKGSAKVSKNVGDISAGSHGEVAAAARSAAVASKKVGDISAGSHGEVAAPAQSP
jgi:hypothetical protein